MDEMGVDESGVEFHERDYYMDDFFRDKFDIQSASVINDLMQATEKGFKINFIRPWEYDVNYYADVIGVKEELINDPEKHDLILGFLKATLKGWDMAFDDVKNTAGLALYYDSPITTQIKQQMILEELEQLVKTDNEIGWMDENTWNRIYNTLIFQNIIEQEIDINDVYTIEFLKEIY